MAVGDFFENFFTGDWTNAFDDPSALPILGGAAALATGGLGLAGIGPLAGLFGAGEAAGAGLLGAEAAGGLGAAEGVGALGFASEAGGAAGAGGGIFGGLGWEPLGWGGATGMGSEFVGPTLEQAGGGVGSFGMSEYGGLADLGVTEAGGGSATQVSGGLAKEPSLWSQLTGGAMNQITRNPLGIGAAGIGLASTAMRGSSMGPNQEKLSGLAAQLGSQGQALQQYLANGTLPPALQAKLDQATAAAKAKIVANHARNGMNTDPAQNSALAQELSAVDTNAVAAMAEAQLKMMQTGLNETGLSAQLYEMLTRMDREDNRDLMNSIANFASALGGGSKGVNINLGRA